MTTSTKMAKARDCPRCNKPLTVKRQNQRKKYCYLCDCAVKREQRQAAHDRRVEKLYGLRPGEYQKLYEVQGGRCAVHGCRARGLSIALAVDHDHAIGLGNRKAVRGLMCKTHNKWIGMAHDDPEVFDSLAGYLRDPPAQRTLT
jgi:hypothetical protein